MKEKCCFKIEKEQENERIDLVLSNILEDYSRSYIKKLIKDGFITVNSNVIKASYKVMDKDYIEVVLPMDKKEDIQAENISIDIVYEDQDVMIVNKPQGMVVHPAPGNYSNTLVNALLFYTTFLSDINGELRPGIIHRIDKDTSGLLMIAKNNESHIDLSEQLKEHSITREYIALTEGIIKEDNGTVKTNIGRHPIDRKRMSVVTDNGKHAITHFQVLERYKKNTLVKAKLETGRTHQIRVHMSHIGHPLVGDPVYGYKKQQFNLKGQLLHAKKIGFIHPTTNRYMEFESELPEHFKKVIKVLRIK